MSTQLKRDLQQLLKETKQDGKPNTEDLVQRLKEKPAYKRTSEGVLRLHIEKFFETKQPSATKDLDVEVELQKRQSMDDPGANGLIKPLKFDNYPVIFFEDLGGMTNIKNNAKQYIQVNIRNRHLYSSLGLKNSPKHLLINGPQGTGKSTLAIAICNEAELNFLKLSLYDPRIYSSLNDGKMSTFLRSVKNSTPCAIILDDIDSFFSGESVTKENERKTLQNLLNFFDEIVDLDIFVIGIVTKIEKLNSALMRSGRFETRLDMKIPDETERERILTHMIKNKAVDELDLKELGISTAGFVASDLQSLLVKAAEEAIKDYLGGQDEHSVSENGCRQSCQFEETSQSMVIESHDKQDSIKDNGTEEATFKIQQKHFAMAVPQVMPIIKKEGFTSIPSTTWSDIGALESLKTELDRLIIKPIQNPEICSKFSIRRQAGVLLYGPPGCGKTMLAKAVANACRANFIYVKGPELLSKYVGESEKAVRGLFERAKLSAPCLIFFDEIDGLCPKRGSDGNQVIERVVNQLLTEMNGVEELNQIYLIGATNRPDIIDRAILRPERLGVHLYVPLPDSRDQIDILRTILRKKPLDQSVEVEKLVEKFNLINFSGADLNAFVEAAARNAAWSDIQKERIGMDDFIQAYQSAKSSITPADVVYYQELLAKFR